MDRKSSQYRVKVDGHFEADIDWRNIEIKTIDLNNERLLFSYGNMHHEAELVDMNLQSKKISLRLDGELFEVEIQDSLDLVIDEMGLSNVDTNLSNELKAPMPGQVKEIMVKEGQEIQEGDPLLVLVAMKMENILKSPTSGVISEIKVQAEDIVNKNDVLVCFEQ